VHQAREGAGGIGGVGGGVNHGQESFACRVQLPGNAV
jgi:hypothetical protein